MRHLQTSGAARWAALVIGVVVLSGCDQAAEPRDDVAPAPAAGGIAAETTGEPLTLAFAGDVHFEGALIDLPGRKGATLGPMSKALRQADLAMVNLEAAITRGGTPAAKELEVAGNRFWFRTPPSALGLLSRSGVDVASVANNHGADYGAVGLRDTLRAAEDGPVALVGVGRDVEQAFTPYRTTIKGTDVSVFGADASPLESNDPTWVIRPGSGPGLASARDDARLVSAVGEAADAGDLVVVYLHWGEEGVSCSTGRQEALARSLSEAGADVIVGAHAHVPLGAGLLGDTYVSYGLGNFFWYHGRQSDTGVLTLTVQDGEVIQDAWVPGRIRTDGGNPQPLAGAARTAAVTDWEGQRACTDLAPGPTAQQQAAADGVEVFSSSVRRIGPGLAAKMTAHDPAVCPVPLSDLRHLSMSYVGFDGQSHRGVMIVDAAVADDVLQVFAALYEARFPIERMRLIDAYDGNDNRSMADNNTSGYNCRRVAGSTSWSDHAFGRAVDINPVQNPYVVGDRVLPVAGRAFVAVDRSAGADTEPGVIQVGDAARRTFDRLGWQWGGTYTDPDYQHFSRGVG